MDKDVQLWIDTAFSLKGIWDDVNNIVVEEIKMVLPKCFIHGTREYEKIDGYENIPEKCKHHLNIRIEMYNDTKRV